MKAERGRGAADQKVPPQVILAMQAMLPDLATKKRQAAEYFLSHPDHVAFMSLRKVALAARVSTGIVMKLLRDLGYQSYGDFKADFQQWVTGRYNYFSATAETATRSASQKKSLLEKIAENDIENIRRTVAGSTVANVRVAAQIIMSARKVFVVGMRVTACIAMYLAYQLAFVREDVILLDNANQTLVDSIADFSTDDVLIAISFFPYASLTAATVEHAIAKGTSVISLTDRENSPITAKRGLTLIFESPWIYNSITASLVLAQVLVAETLVLSGNDALRRINKRERLFQTFAVFEK